MLDRWYKQQYSANLASSDRQVSVSEQSDGPVREWKGIGRLPCQEGEQILQSRGYVEVVLWVFEANQQARGFYEALGFETDGSTRALSLGVPLTAVRYRKSLGSAEADKGIA